MNIINVTQGSQDWLDVRAKHFTASECPAMMGVSKYKSRAALLSEKATGITEEIDPAKQRLFDAGHAAEAAARPIVEDILKAELFPATGTLEIDGLMLLASFDGITMLEDMAWESKLFNAKLAGNIGEGKVEPHYAYQLEQQCLVAGLDRVYFTTSDGTPENTIGMWYESCPAMRAALIAGWKQFAEDLANHVHVEKIAAPTAATIEALPALFVQVEGKVLATNLDAFKASAQTFIDGIKTELVNDQDFADADKMVKFLKDGEDRLALAKQQALAQTASIDELFRTVDAISEQMRSKRLALDRLVKAEKVNRKAAIINDAHQAIKEHIAKLNARIGGNWIPQVNGTLFTEATTGLKSLDSMRDKVATALSFAKIEANEIANTIDDNRKSLDHAGSNSYLFLFPDFAQVCTKSADDFALLAEARIRQHMDRLEADRIAETSKQADIGIPVSVSDQRGKPPVIEREAEVQGQDQVEDRQSTPPNQDHIADAGKRINAFFASVGTPIGKQENYRTVIQAWERFNNRAIKADDMAEAA